MNKQEFIVAVAENHSEAIHAEGTAGRFRKTVFQCLKKVFRHGVFMHTLFFAEAAYFVSYILFNIVQLFYLKSFVKIYFFL